MDPTMVRRAGQVADGALGWLGRMRASFALPRDLPDHEIDGNALKALADLALAGGTVRREAVAGEAGARTAEELLDYAWREFRFGELLLALQRQAPAASHPTEIYSLFAAAGYRHPRLDSLAEHLAGLRAAAVPEQAPNRRLAVLAANRRLGLPDPPDTADLVARSWLGGTPEPWMLDANTAHGVAHTVCHLTDYAAHPGGLPPLLQEYLHRWLPVWVEVFTETRSWDLLGELLIVAGCLDRPHGYADAWEQLALAQRPDGMLPNGVNPPPSDPEQAFRDRCHPTVVAVVAGTLTVSRALAVAS
ncbi:DUF6895 family protein [Kitasatospora azatica]|uniref:DUF6895 family protein n=1 Tax=Kitasatospora azatica TaxID=58347 RepID=UPI00056A894B|nr:hypothetical protein [Kitasatospora azatica]